MITPSMVRNEAYFAFDQTVATMSSATLVNYNVPTNTRTLIRWFHMAILNTTTSADLANGILAYFPDGTRRVLSYLGSSDVMRTTVHIAPLITMEAADTIQVTFNNNNAAGVRVFGSLILEEF